jgi:hypothetical protein
MADVSRHRGSRAPLHLGETKQRYRTGLRLAKGQRRHHRVRMNTIANSEVIAVRIQRCVLEILEQRVAPISSDFWFLR